MKEIIFQINEVVKNESFLRKNYLRTILYILVSMFGMTYIPLFIIDMITGLFKKIFKRN